MVSKAELAIIPGGSITSPRGFRAGATYCGLKSAGAGKLDLALLVSDVPCVAAGVFTTNRLKAAPVQVCQDRLAAALAAQAVIINAGIANAGTGQQGLDTAEQMTESAARKLGVSPQLALVASTGKIGWQIPLDKVKAGVSAITVSETGGHDLARAIMTTDTRPKEIAVTFSTPAGRGKGPAAIITVAGVAKGAGMIHPDMATLIAVVTTDAAIDPAILKPALKRAADRSFNMLSVDGDMSTNDTLLLLANGMANTEPIRQGSAAARLFQSALDMVCIHLAKAIAADGEGATRLVEVTVRGAVSVDDARRAARAISSSNLTKCAIHGADPNWGRIAAAAGRSGALMDQMRLDVAVGDVWLMRNGTPLSYDADKARAILSGATVPIVVDFHLGLAEATAWGCDMSEEYVTFNSDYTT
jgi:glutamate N-acetyltransferase/amino-acid N-acetyltransferase